MTKHTGKYIIAYCWNCKNWVIPNTDNTCKGYSNKYGFCKWLKTETPRDHISDGYIRRGKSHERR